ncbi:exodeoxyribonuclease I [Xanthomonas campestris pv. raphani]|uniref:exodeoxyribonuclease I n=1 Tax=Xanthomonas campestris TaxID=339 RepID=UPI000E328B91|nr:exodeoxyribonuclease I [Xanthomonas campestris]MEA9793986.1 exodeoxyribonuclease I [Xanthomonas campestris pv. raphani]RFF49717.1 exodeoxyribonuclease I [Xanthomonas campestris]WDJ04778.1 exodeoxyribonuclease I [Xanthomonas campestris pv. incanae]
MPDSFLFYDLETFGQDPRRTRIAQFAAVRTDAQLRVIEEPISFFVQPADDLLPSPYATMVTGITPQHALREGVNEAEAFARIAEQMGRPQTCTLGYNSIRFDDEFVRCGLFRNFYDPYEREWRGGNSRWDLLDVLRLVHALRPDGIVWPQREDGATSFKLEHLADANAVREGDAHEALSDVYATIGMARKFQQSQPKLWDYALRLRDKRFAASLLDVIAMQPVLHISQRYPATRLCAAAVLPLTRHPRIDSRVIVFDLDGDPDALLRLSPDEIADRLYIRAADLPDGEQRIPLKEVHLNKAPALVAWQHLRSDDFQRLGVDRAAVEAKAARLRELGPELAEKVRQVYGAERAGAAAVNDADASLYDGFLAEGDKRLLTQVRSSAPAELGALEARFRDPRLIELLFRYRARNWPQTLSPDEHQRWNDYRRQRLLEDRGLGEVTLEQFYAQIADLRLAHSDDATKQSLLDQLAAWGSDLQRTL